MKQIGLTVLSAGILIGSLVSHTLSGDCTAEFPDSVRLSWRLVKNQYQESSRHLAELTLTNKADVAFPDQNWALYFNWFRRIVPDELDERIHGRNIDGDFYELTPSSSFPVIQPGDSVVLSVVGTHYELNTTDAPSGAYFVRSTPGDTTIVPVDIHVHPVDPADCFRSDRDVMPVWTPEEQYARNEQVSPVTLTTEAPDLIPSPVRADYSGRMITLTPEWSLEMDPRLETEAAWFQAQLGFQLSTQSRSSRSILSLDVDPESFSGTAKRPEAYRLNITPDRVKITGYDPAGVFYALTTLLALQAPDDESPQSITLPAGRILDYPRFPYRGLHVDVARNFHDAGTIRQVLDEMARYKLNRLHFHLTDDEGWRLDIPGLPELTGVGAYRGHTLTETDHLIPSLGSGPDPKHSRGSGYYSRETFIDLLQYAHARHIRILPEIDMPGHAHAAITAMQARYRRLARAGRLQEASEYLLTHPQDTSSYRSVQNWKNNAVDPALESTYRFLETVVTEVDRMYREAGMELKMLHMGGDEVAAGAWSGSPACQQLMANHPDIKSQHDLFEYFIGRMAGILEERGIRPAGWEEIAMQIVDTKKIPNPAVVDRRFVPYVWNSVWGWGGEDLAYRLANAGFEVVLSNVTTLYFDLAYNKHPQEPGLYWGGYVDTRRAWEFTPTDVTLCAETDLNGRTIDVKSFDRFQPLAPESESRLMGMQGHLWGENIRSTSRLHYFLFPKVLGLAQRAWSPKPVWEERSLPGQRRSDWNRFVTLAGERELPRLARQGVEYRIPPPGAVVRQDTLYMNTLYPGLTPVYQIDNQPPTVYTGPVRLSTTDAGDIQVWSRDVTGRQSRKSML